MDLIKVGALWKKTDKNGQNFLTGGFGDAQIFVMPNRFKDSEKAPDYILFVAPKEKAKKTQTTETTQDI